MCRPTLIVTLLVAIVLAVMTSAVTRLGQQAEREWTIATDVRALQAGVYRLSALEWQAVAEGRLAPEARREVAVTLRTARATLAGLRRTSDSPDLRRFAGALSDYTAAVEREFALLTRGRLDEAEAVDEELVDPAFARVDRAAAVAVGAHRAAAEDRGMTTRSGTVLAALLGFALIALVVTRFQRTVRALAAARAAESVRREGEEWLHALLGNASDTVVVTDAAGRLTWVSAAVEGLLGVPAADLVGTDLRRLAADADDADRVLAGLQVAPGARGDLQVRLRRADGRAVDVEARVTNLLGHATVRGIVVNIRDVGDRVALEGRLRHQALHDPLTGLANRALFEDRLGHALASARRAGRRPAVLFCDLDDFKTVNDSLGHEAGDTLLAEVGRRLVATLRDADSVARLGGDEFAVLVEDAADGDAVATVAERVLAAVAAPVELLGRRLVVHGSVGIAIGDGAADAQALLRQADVAMYAAKREGKGRFRLFEQRMHEAVVQRLELKADLSRAVERGELFLAYQPIVDIASSRLVGVEALLRWHHPERGVVAPDEFIPMAEESGLIVPIGRWVLGEATRQLAEWRRQRPGAAPGHVSVNVAGAQLRDRGFVGDVAAAIDRAGIEPGDLILEVTESSLIDDDGSAGCLGALRALGTRLAIDDFGSGYSALNYLRRFPLDILKIDRSFVGGVTTVARDAALTRAMIAMAGALGLEVVAEGVEDDEQLSTLQALRCGMAQGYLFSPPVAPGEVLALADAAAITTA